MAKGRMKQLHIAAEGIEPIGIVEINDLASIFYGHQSERMAMQKLETSAKAELMAAIKRHAEAGELKPSPDCDGKLVPIYSFQYEDGEELFVKWGKVENVKVNKSHKASDAGGDDD